MDIDITTLVSWSEPKLIETRNGPRMLSKAEATPEFWDAWKAAKDDLKAAGISCGKSPRGGWEVNWWQPVPDEITTQRAEAVEQSRATDAEVDLPRPEGLNYLPFQRAGIRYALDRHNVLIGDEMGLGKTIQAIGIINSVPAITTALIICPKTLKINWRNELKKWLVRPLSIAVVNGKGWVESDIIIINYDALEKYSVQLRSRTWGALILDEAHLIKNSKTLRSIYIKGGERDRGETTETVTPIQAARHIRLTGTPIQNKPVELYNIISDLHPAFAHFFTYGKRYCAGHQKQAGRRVVWDFSGASNLDELQRRLRETIMVRRLKAEVLTELPAKIRQVIEIDPETAEARAAVEAEQAAESESDDRLTALRADVELAKAESAEAYAQAVKRLRDAEEIEFTRMSKLRHETALRKVPAVITFIDGLLEDNDQKVIIAAHHHDVIDGLAAGLASYNPVILTGAQDDLEREAAVQAFQNDPATRVFIGGIMAAGVGITLTAASTVVFAELDWVPGNVSQMEDRAHRIGQLNTVLIYHIVMSGTVDARMAHVLIEKQSIIDSALDKRHPERAQAHLPHITTVSISDEALKAAQSRSAYRPRNVAATADDEPDELDKIGATLTADVISLIHSGLRILAGMDYDGAREMNGVGFNKIDTAIGRSLAGREVLSPRMAALGMKMVRKYHRQLPEEINQAVRLDK